MTWKRSWLRAKFFANSDSLQILALPDHNEALAGDTLTTISFNYQWREIVASALQFYFNHDESALGLDNEDLLNNVLNDLYTAESFGGMDTRVNTVVLPGTKTTTSTSFIAVPDSSFSHTFSKPNALIRCSNILARNNTVSQTCEVQIRVAGAAGNESGNGLVNGTTNQPLVAVARFEGIETGVSKAIELYFRANAGTAVVTALSWLVFEIEEYD